MWTLTHWAVWCDTQVVCSPLIHTNSSIARLLCPHFHAFYQGFLLAVCTVCVCVCMKYTVSLYFCLCVCVCVFVHSGIFEVTDYRLGVQVQCIHVCVWACGHFVYSCVYVCVFGHVYMEMCVFVLLFFEIHVLQEKTVIILFYALTELWMLAQIHTNPIILMIRNKSQVHNFSVFCY